MSDTTIGIEVTANTSAAVTAMQDLAAAEREATTAAEGAGQGQKTLAQETAAAREKQLAAAEAVRRAQAALAEHSATVAAHGRESKEAAASLARLKAAQAEAAKQAEIADKAVAAVATSTAQAVREADKLTPALARVSREVKQAGASAERAASDVRKLELAIVAAEKGQRGWGATMASFAGNLGAGAVAFGLDKFKDAVQWAAEHNAEFGGSMGRLGEAATKFGESLLNGPLGRGLTAVVDGLTGAVEKTIEWGEWLGILEGEVKSITYAAVEFERPTEGITGAMFQAMDVTGEYAKKLVELGLVQLNAADAARQHRDEVDALWDKLAQRNAAAEASILEAEFFAANEMGPALPPGFKRPGEGGGRRREEGPSAKALSRDIDDVAGVGASTKLAEEAEARRLKDLEKFEKAQTKLEAQEQKRREEQLKKALEREEELLQQRQERVQRVTDAVLELGGGLVDGIERAMDGEKFAIASALEETLRAVAKKNAILALEQGALAVAAAASYNYPKAAQHGVAMGLHVGVAAAAGVGAHIAGSVAGGGSSSASGGGAASGASGGSRGGSGGSGDGMEAQEVAVSHEQLRRADASARDGAVGGLVVNINNPTIVGAGGVREVATMIRKELERQDRGGRRPSL